MAFQSAAPVPGGGGTVTTEAQALRASASARRSLTLATSH